MMLVPENESDHSSPIIRIRPSQTRFTVGFSDLWHYRELLYFLVWRDVKVLYKQTAIGAAWAILQPLLTMVVFTLVFSKFAKIPSDGLPYPIFSFAALLPWTYFAKALTQSITSVVGNSHLISKVYFPRLLLPISAAVEGLIDFTIGFTFLLGMFAWYGIVPNLRSVVLVPFFIFLAMLTALSVSVWFSVINVRYRDV